MDHTITVTAGLFRFEKLPSLLCAGRALTGVVLLAGSVPPVVLEDTDFGMRRSGPREADRAGARLTGWKMAPASFVFRPLTLYNLRYADKNMLTRKNNSPKLGRIAKVTLPL